MDATALLIAELTTGRHTIAIAESLTGGLLAAELIRVPGASRVVNGAVVSYNTELKHTLLGVDTSILNVHGPVHPDVAKQMAGGARTLLGVGGDRASIGVSTTGVAGPFAQDGHEPGTAFIGLSMGNASWAVPVQVLGDRDAVRRQIVLLAVDAVRALLARESAE
ncbi:MAG: nicotinamide-nucleotide amidohydrolase family protein [Cryobacterium sp.]